MGSIASLGRMVSGLSAAQKGLQVTGHNIANLNTKGYTRQQLLQHESSYLNIGSNGSLMQVGLGVSLTEIRQIRDELADSRYREETSILNFYQTKNDGIQEVEAILDEPNGESISKMLNNFWSQTQKLSTNPSGVEERLAFIQSANVLVKRANQISDAFTTYQHNLDKAVRTTVDKVNTILDQLQEYNDKISKAEAVGDNANDYRDGRNVLLDELSSYVDIDYYEDKDQRVVVKAEGEVVLDKGYINHMELEQTKPMSPFVKPVWSTTHKDVFDFSWEVNSKLENDAGKLKALMITRGETPATLTTTWQDIALNDNKSVEEEGNSYFIPKLQKQLAIFMNEITDSINDIMNGDGLADHKGVPVFVPVKVPSGVTLPALPDKTDPDYETKYKTYLDAIKPYLTPGNIQVNPDLLKEGGYNQLGTVPHGTDNPGDNSEVIELLNKWGEPRKWFETTGNPAEDKTKPKEKTVNFMNFYSEYVSEMGQEGYIYKGKTQEKLATVNNVNMLRQAMGGVSQDEEFTSMLKYQYAYNASARMVTMLDGMMDTIINRL